ncbi:MAG TPA: gephyrin-like molybdotransferase Glp [Verrucomicrobiae bacterium]
MISLEEAKERLFASIKTARTERVPLIHALGRICAEPISSLVDLPGFDNSAMDGYAVRADDLRSASESQPIELKVIGRIGAGETFGGIVSPGTCLRLFTGSVVPEGADAVVMQEEVHAENGAARFAETVKPFENIRLRGEDIRTGTQIADAGDLLNATRLALLAATGHSEVAVSVQPRIALLATGDELVEPGLPLGPGKIYESNRLLLASLLRSLQIKPTVLPLVPDTLEATTSTLEAAFANHEVVITTGGVSVGEFDFVKEAFTRIGGVIDHWKVAIRPGKPFVFGRLEKRFLFGLPGNPVSALVTFLVLVRPALLKMMGARECELATVGGELTAPISNPGDRRHFVRCEYKKGGVRPLGRQASHMLGSLGDANCLVDVPPATRLDAGTMVSANLF